MISFIFLFVILLILLLATVVLLTAGGSVFLLIFGDAIICIWIIVKLIKKIFKKK